MKRAFTVVIAVMVIASSLFASGVGLTGVGGRATTLGGNYRAVSNDWSGMFWNPAGLVWSKGLNAGASLEFITPTAGYTAAQLNGKPFSATYDAEVNNEAKTFLMPAFGVYYSNEKMAFGLGFWAPFGLGAKWDLLNTSKYNSAYPAIDHEDNLKVVALQPTFAYKLSEKFSVGAGLTLLYADILIRKPQFTPNPVAASPLKAALGAATLAPFDQILTEVNLDGTGMGFGAALGVQYKPIETLTLGVAAKYYNDISLDGTLMADTYYPKDPGNVKLTMDQLKAANLIDAATYAQIVGAYSGQKAPAIAKMDVTANLPLPMTVGAGFAFTGIKNLLVTGDVALSQWSAWKVIEAKDANGNLAAELVQNWEDGIRMGLGFEYSLALANAKVRAAFYSEPRAPIDETLAPIIPDANRRNVMTFGFGLPVGPATISLMYEHMFIGNYTVEEWSLNESKNGYNNMAGDYSMQVRNFMIGLEYGF